MRYYLVRDGAGPPRIVGEVGGEYTAELLAWDWTVVRAVDAQADPELAVSLAAWADRLDETIEDAEHLEVLADAAEMPFDELLADLRRRAATTGESWQELLDERAAYVLQREPAAAG